MKNQNSKMTAAEIAAAEAKIKGLRAEANALAKKLKEAGTTAKADEATQLSIEEVGVTNEVSETPAEEVKVTEEVTESSKQNEEDSQTHFELDDEAYSEEEVTEEEEETSEEEVEFVPLVIEASENEEEVADEVAETSEQEKVAGKESGDSGKPPKSHVMTGLLGGTLLIALIALLIAAATMFFNSGADTPETDTTEQSDTVVESDTVEQQPSDTEESDTVEQQPSDTEESDTVEQQPSDTEESDTVEQEPTDTEESDTVEQEPTETEESDTTTEEPTETEEPFEMNEFVSSVVNIAEQLTDDKDIDANANIFCENIGENKLEELIDKYDELSVQKAIAEFLAFVPEIKMNQYIRNNGLDYNPNAMNDWLDMLDEASAAYTEATGKNPEAVIMSLEGYDTYKSSREAMKVLIIDSGDTALLTWYEAKTDGYVAMIQQCNDTEVANAYKEEVKLELVNNFKGSVKLIELQLEKNINGTNADTLDYTEVYEEFIINNYMYVVAN